MLLPLSHWTHCRGTGHKLHVAALCGGLSWIPTNSLSLNGSYVATALPRAYIYTSNQYGLHVWIYIHWSWLLHGLTLLTWLSTLGINPRPWMHTREKSLLNLSTLLTWKTAIAQQLNSDWLSHTPDIGPRQTLFTGWSWSVNNSRHEYRIT